VVHGRNEKIRKSMFVFLRSISLQPLEWPQIVKEIEKPNPYIGEVLDKGFSMSQATVILMTPDDEAKLKIEFVKDTDPNFESELTPQPRQNVLIEVGMALGKFPERTIIVQFGILRQISDLLGKHVIRLNNSGEQRHELAQRLETCGCEVDVSGKDWFSDGDFDLKKSSISKINNEISESDKKDESKNKLVQNYSGPSGGIQLLIENEFFVQPKNFSDIVDALKDNNYHYPRSTINAVLVTVFIKNRKILNRMKEQGAWKYVLRK